MKKPQLIVCIFIFLACVLIYFSNETSITSNDDVPTSILALNWLENHQLNFDVFRDNPFMYTEELDFVGKQRPYYFIESSNGHLSAKYPIGPAIVSFPIYALFFLCIKAHDAISALITNMPVDSLDLLSKEFLRSQRPSFEGLAATLITALSVVLFYLASNLKFGQSTALLSSFIFGCSTSVWVVCSQGLRQHTVSNFVLLAAMLALFKANRTSGNTQRVLLLSAGFFAGLLHSSRPTSLLFFAALIAYCAYIYRKKCFFFLLGASSILLGIAWNVYYFGFSNFLKGGYAELTGLSQTYSLSYFPESAIGLLFSPNRGWLILCPVLLFIVPGIRRVFRWSAGDDEKLLACLSLACLALYVQYWFYFAWSGVLVYGPSRFLIDVLPVLCFLINYFIYEHLKLADSSPKKLLSPVIILFIACIVFSTFVQVIGAFGNSTWANIPTAHRERLWNINDSVVERTSRGLLFDIRDPIADKKSYAEGLNGEILNVVDVNNTPAKDGTEVATLRRLTLAVTVKNTGTSPWYGYESGASQGLTQLVIDLDTPDGDFSNTHRKNKLYISGVKIAPGETAIAIGDIKFPAQKGPYDMRLSFDVTGLGGFPTKTEDVMYRIRVLSNRQMIKKYGEILRGFSP